MGLGVGFIYLRSVNNSALIEAKIWVHELLFSIIIWLISLRIFAAIYNWIQHDLVWSSMVPFFEEMD